MWQKRAEPSPSSGLGPEVKHALGRGNYDDRLWPKRRPVAAPVELAGGGAPRSSEARRRLYKAVHALRRRHPELSAGAPTWLWQKLTVAAIIGIWAGASFHLPSEMASLVLTLLALPFVCVVILRVFVVWHALGPDRGQSIQRAPPLTDAELPSYALLIPLFREAEVVPDLVRAIETIDYPRNKLDVYFVLESGDAATRTAVARQRAEPHVRTIIVPDGQPRTKPRALNYALQHTASDVVVVYDAEDMPEPDQLRRAAAKFRSAHPPYGCLQARLAIHNSSESWLTRQFTIEYAVLFRAILPALETWQLPLPLGGTSNHFPRAVLESAGGWDPYNVTEDADLGIRLARLGWRVGMLNSATWEEAPARFPVWWRQRSRWLKGWMQTYLVHMRRPVKLCNELGLRRFMGFQILMGGIMLSALVHPWLLVMLAFSAWHGHLGEIPHAIGDGIAYWISVFNLGAGYSAAILLGILIAARGGAWALLPHALLMPLYWVLISFAAYRAVWQLATAPFLWEKTRHRARTR